MNASKVRPSLCAAILAGTLTIFTGHVHAFESQNFTCTGSVSGGTVDVQVSGGFPVVSREVVVTIPPNTDAETKCLFIATAFEGQFVTGVAGPTITFTSAVGTLVSVKGDTTGEFTTLSATLNPGDTVRLYEFFSSNLSLVPPAGTFFSGFFLKPPIGVTIPALGNGVDDGATILNTFDSNFTARTNIPFNDPILQGSQQIGWRTPFFDPTIVEIGWDGNTALDLANFGLEIQPAASVPEPETLALLGIGLAGLGFSRRRKRS